MSETDSKTSSTQESGVKPKNGKKKEEKRLARLVQRKLEDYMNKTKREEHFDPTGVHRTTARMHKYDLTYKLIEATALEKSAKQKLKAQAKSGNVQPKLVKNSRQVTRGMEVASITASVTKVLEEVPVRDLTALHAYRRPSTRHSAEGAERTDVRYQGYTRHVGAVLHTKKYADYYLEQGLNTGNSEVSPRLRDLKTRRGSLSSTGTESTLSTTSRGSQPSQHGARAADENVAPSDDSKQDGPIAAETLVAATVDPEQEAAADEAVQTSLTTPNDKQTQTGGLTPDTTLSTQSTPDTTLNEQTPDQNPTTGKNLTPTEDVGAEGGDYSDDFEEEDIEEEEELYSAQRKSSPEDEDARSTQTYMSVEHAEEVRPEEIRQEEDEEEEEEWKVDVGQKSSRRIQRNYACPDF